MLDEAPLPDAPDDQGSQPDLQPHVVREIFTLTMAALRANLLPGSVIICVVIAVTIGYFSWPPVTQLLDAWQQWQEHGGVLAAMLTTALAGAVLPALVQRLMGMKQSSAVVTFLALFWATKGIEVRYLYRLQEWLFGPSLGTDGSMIVSTVVQKVLFDQYVYVPVWAVPSLAVAYLLAAHEVRFRQAWAALNGRWVRTQLLPLLLANQFVWVPAVTFIYLLPLGLQVPIQNLVLLFWSLVALVLSARQPGNTSVPQ
jgi:hypothetical protein